MKRTSAKCPPGHCMDIELYFFFSPNWLKKAACEMRIHACSFQLTTQEWPHQTFKWQIIMNGNDCRFRKHLWNLLWCVHANLSGSSALGQKGVWEGCRHTAFSIGFKITLNPQEQMSNRCPEFFLGLPVTKPFHVFGTASQQCLCCKLWAPCLPAPSTLQCSYGYRPAAPTWKNILMNLAPFCERF